MNASRSHWWLVNISSGNGLMLSGKKANFDPDICHHMVSPLDNEFNRKTIQISPSKVCRLWVVRNSINTLRPRQDGRHFPDNTFERIFLKENVIILIKISLKFVPKGPINNIPALFQIMPWRRSGDKPLSEPMMVRLLTHICITRPQWVKITPCIEMAFNLLWYGNTFHITCCLSGNPPVTREFPHK